MTDRLTENSDNKSNTCMYCCKAGMYFITLKI